MTTSRNFIELGEGANFVGHRSKRSCKAFQRLPYELNLQIGLHIEDDRDIASFASVCISTANAIYGDDRHFWRRRFQGKFDEPSAAYKACTYKNNGMFQMIYCRYRYPAFAAGRNKFCVGATFEEERTLREIIQVMNEAHPLGRYGDGNLVSRNVEFVRNFVTTTPEGYTLLALGTRYGTSTRGLLNNIFHRDHENPTERMCVVMLCFTDVILGLEDDLHKARLVPTFGWDSSKVVAYTERTDQQKLAGNYKEGNIMFRELLHLVNYFKPFLTSEEYPFTKSCYADSELGRAGMPHGWNVPFCTEGASLGSTWRGTYGFLDHMDLGAIRRGGILFSDRTDDCNVDGMHNDPFQTLQMQESRSEEVLARLTMFERFLHNGIVHPTDKGQLDSKLFSFVMGGVDGEDAFNGVGCLTPLPNQLGLRGCMRMTMMKYYADDDDDMDLFSLWAYEGVIMPGGNVMIGKWWRADWDGVSNTPEGVGEDSGPFLFWNIPDDIGQTRGRSPNEEEYDPNSFTEYAIAEDDVDYNDIDHSVEDANYDSDSQQGDSAVQGASPGYTNSPTSSPSLPNPEVDHLSSDEEHPNGDLESEVELDVARESNEPTEHQDSLAAEAFTSPGLQCIGPFEETDDEEEEELLTSGKRRIALPDSPELPSKKRRTGDSMEDPIVLDIADE